LSGERNPACESVILLFEANGGVMRQKLLLRQSLQRRLCLKKV
jgi:hypothetical protein